MKRKLTLDDRNLLTQVVKDHGADWTYKALAVWYVGWPIDELPKVKRWTRKRQAAFRFLREIIDDYTFNAIYDAVDDIQTPNGMVECGLAANVGKSRKTLS